MTTVWNLADITADEWRDPDTYALLARRYGGERNLRAVVFGLRPDLVAAEFAAICGNDTPPDLSRTADRPQN